jgi:hypothetical protein
MRNGQPVKCVGLYRGFYLFNDGGYLLAIGERYARTTGPCPDEEIILGGDEGGASLHFLFLIIESRGRSSEKRDFMMLDWR